MHSTAAPYIGTGGSILLRDIWWRYVRPQDCSDAKQIWVNRLFATVITLANLRKPDSEQKNNLQSHQSGKAAGLCLLP